MPFAIAILIAISVDLVQTLRHNRSLEQTLTGLSFIGYSIHLF